MQPEIPFPENPLYHRVEYQNCFGTVKYCGKLQHTAEKNDQIWLGVEWDDETRGKHNGTVENFVYFQTKNNKNSGSLLKVERANFGIEILDGIISKYFKEDPLTIKEQLLQEFAIMDNFSDNQKAEEESKTSEMLVKKEKGPISVEYDEDAYFETIRKHKKKVEFVGFDRIWKKINNLKEIQEISLQELHISAISLPNILKTLLPNLKNLALEKNLLFDYQQVLQIGHEFPLLESLSLSYNRLKTPEKPLSEYSKIDVFLLKEPALKININQNIFPCLKTLILVEMGLDWHVLSKVLTVFPALEELILCRNHLNDFENLTIDVEKYLKNLKFLNLEENAIGDFSGVLKFSQLKSLEKLTLSRNFFQKFGKFDGFDSVNNLSVEWNLFEDPIILHEMSQFKSLKTLRIKENPLISKYGAPYVRQRAVAENPAIIAINGSDLKKYDRKDFEIFYLRRTFEDFFKSTNSFYYKYDFDDFLNNYCKDHPSIPRLLKIYGNPFEMDPNEGKVEQPVIQKNVMLILKITALAGPLVGKDPVKKKFPDSTTIVNLKAVLAKLLSIPLEKINVLYRAPNRTGEPMEVLEEELKSLSYYSVCNGGDIFADEKN